jgi:N,N'-diacetylchitobiose transport system permease protein
VLPSWFSPGNSGSLELPPSPSCSSRCCRRTKAFLRITFPLLAPGLVASGVYAFLQAWNEFTVALVVLQDNSAQTLPLWLRGFIQASASRATDWGQVMAASTLVALPVIIFFLVVQGRMTSGLVSEAVKR